jgi:hypothetical protein
VSKRVGEHHDEVGAQFDVPRRGGAHRVELSVVVRVGGDEPAVGARAEGRRSYCRVR